MLKIWKILFLIGFLNIVDSFIVYRVLNLIIPSLKNTRTHDAQTEFVICRLQFDYLKRNDKLSWNILPPTPQNGCPHYKWFNNSNPEMISLASNSKIFFGTYSGLPDVNSITKEDPRYHFDNDLQIRATNERLIKDTQDLISFFKENDMSLKNIINARQSLGYIIHTIQDFYSHTNWIESNFEGIAENIGFSQDFKVPLNEASRAGCGNCETVMTTEEKSAIELDTGNNLVNMILSHAGWKEKNTFVCRDNIILHDALHTGYVGGELLDEKGGQCGHGGGAEESSNTFPTGGINKDGESVLFSPHYYLHRPAAEKAVQATLFYMNRLRQEIQDETKWGQFLGVVFPTDYVQTLKMATEDDFSKLPVYVKLVGFNPPAIFDATNKTIKSGKYMVVLQCEECSSLDSVVMVQNQEQQEMTPIPQEDEFGSWSLGTFDFSEGDKIIFSRINGTIYDAKNSRSNLASFEVV